MTSNDPDRENHRRAADRRLVAAVQDAGKGSREYRELGDALADLVIGTLFNLDRRGVLFHEVRRQCGIRLEVPPATDHRRHLGEIVFHSAGEAVPAFLEQWVLGGRWHPEGAALSTCAVRAGLYAFADEFKQFFARHRILDPELIGPEQLEVALEGRLPVPTGVATVPSPEHAVLDRLEVEELLAGAGPRIAAMVTLSAEGHSHKDIGDRLGMHPEAVSSALRRFRAQFR